MKKWDNIISPTRFLKFKLVETGEHDVTLELFDLLLWYVLLSALVQIWGGKSVVNYIKVHRVEDIIGISYLNVFEIIILHLIEVQKNIIQFQIIINKASSMNLFEYVHDLDAKRVDLCFIEVSCP